VNADPNPHPNPNADPGVMFKYFVVLLYSYKFTMRNSNKKVRIQNFFFY
jgi:hypothetical protein